MAASRPDRAGLTGVVLCGGASRRMGRDKARLTLEGVPLIERVVGALAEACGTVKLATGSAPRYGELGLETLVDRVAGAGPLAGLEAALAGSDTERVAVFACDMPWVRGGLIEALDARLREAKLDGCLLAGPDGLEPLAAVYRTTCLPHVTAALERGDRRLIAFHAAPGRTGARIGSLASDELSAELRASVTNLNTPDDWRRVSGEDPS